MTDEDGYLEELALRDVRTPERPPSDRLELLARVRYWQQRCADLEARLAYVRVMLEPL